MAMPVRPRRSYEFGPFHLDGANRVLLREGGVLPLPPKVIETLLVLVENHGRPVGKDELLKTVWPNTFVEESNLTQHISILRRTLGEHPGGQGYIETLPKRGYRFVPPIGVVEEPAAVEESSTKLRVLPQGPVRPRPRRWLFLPLGLVALASLIAAYYVWLWPVGRTTSRDPAFSQLTDQPGEELYPSLSPDGNSFVYASRASGNWDIYWQRVGGKNAMNLTKDCPFDDTQPVFSPDGGLIAFRSEREGGGIFVMEATGESVRRVADSGYNPAWSPDGTEIVCATVAMLRADHRVGSESWLFAVGAVGTAGARPGDKRQVTTPKEDAMQPHWSPHGLRIAYRSQWDGRRNIWTVSARGGAPVRVTNDEDRDWNPVWSPDGRYLFFSSDRSGTMNLWRVPIEEATGKVLGSPQPITTPSPYSGYFSLSRDGRRIAYVQQSYTSNLYRVGFDPSRETVVGRAEPVTQGSRAFWGPDVSPDGKWLAFSSRGRQEDIFVIRTDGTGLRQVTNDIYRDRLPRWSPDGTRIGFFSDRTGKFEIWIMNPDGGGLDQLTSGSPGVGAHVAVWSPDGKRLAYTVLQKGAFIQGVGEPRKKQTPEALPALGEPQAFFWAQDWSPDGRKLAGARVNTGGVGSGICIYSFESRRFRQLTDSGWAALWLRDSRGLIFQDKGNVYLIDTQSNRVPKLLFSLNPQQTEPSVTLSRDDHLIYFTLADSQADVWLMSLP